MTQKFDLEVGQEVRVFWNDSMSFPGWRTIADTITTVDEATPEVKSMGIVIDINKHRLIIAPHFSHRNGVMADQVGDAMVIPINCIVNVDQIND